MTLLGGWGDIWRLEGTWAWLLPRGAPTLLAVGSGLPLLSRWSLAHLLWGFLSVRLFPPP